MQDEISIVLCLLGANIVIGAYKKNDQKGKENNGQEINVLNFVNSDTEIWKSKESLNVVPSLAVLGDDPRGALPKSFSICSDIMSVQSKVPNFLMFFNLLGRNGEQLLPALMFNGRLYLSGVTDGQIPPLFPNQWVKSCLSIDSNSGNVQWVEDGNLVENRTIETLMGSRVPDNLTGKIIFGAFQLGTDWMVFSNKVANLNIFSSLLPLAVMQERTKGDDVCLEDGDYLAWSEMTWDLRGKASIEKIGQNKTK